jgi:hypothetical protein
MLIRHSCLQQSLTLHAPVRPTISAICTKGSPASPAEATEDVRIARSLGWAAERPENALGFLRRPLHNHRLNT